MCRVLPGSVKQEHRNYTPADSTVPTEAEKENVGVWDFVPARRLFAGVPAGPQEPALAGFEPDLGSSPGWVLEVEVVAVAETWDLLVPRSCEAGRRTGRGI